MDNLHIDTKLAVTAGIGLFWGVGMWLSEGPIEGLVILAIFTSIIYLAFRRQIGELIYSLAERGVGGSPSPLYASAAKVLISTLPKKNPGPGDVAYAAMIASAWVESGATEVSGTPIYDYVVNLLTPYVSQVDPTDSWSQMLLYRFAEAAYEQGRYADAYAISGRAPIGRHDFDNGWLASLAWMHAVSGLRMGKRDEAERAYSHLYANMPSFWGTGNLRAMLDEA